MFCPMAIQIRDTVFIPLLSLFLTNKLFLNLKIQNLSENEKLLPTPLGIVA